MEGFSRSARIAGRPRPGKAVSAALYGHRTTPSPRIAAAHQNRALDANIRLDVILAHRETMSLLLRDASVYSDETTQVMSRMVAIVDRAIELLAGPDPERRRRVRAAQAFAAATDPISQFPDVPPHDLRAELLRGATAISPARREDAVPPTFGRSPTSPPD